MPAFPERFTVLHEAQMLGPENSMGESATVFDEPREVKIYGFAPPSADTEMRPLGTGQKSDLDVYASHPFANHGDRVTIQGLPYKVIGSPESYNFGPFGFTPGCLINLVKIEG